MKNHYVYILLDPRDKGEYSYDGLNIEGKPFYVGISSYPNKRYLTHYTESYLSRDSNINKSIFIKRLNAGGFKPKYIIITDGLSRIEAENYEMMIIRFFGRILDGGILYNIADYRTNTKSNINGKQNIHSKTVFQYSKNGKFIREWGCLRDIGRELGLSYNSIGDACRGLLRGKMTSAYGYIWSYDFIGITCHKYKYYNGQEKKCVFVMLGSKYIEFKSNIEAANFLGVDKGNFYKYKKKKAYKEYNIFESRNQVVDHARSLGFDCFQVNYGDF